MSSEDAFNDRAGYYHRSRPGYPQDVLNTLREQFSLSLASVVADIGSGTGRLARLFVDYGCRVIGVEPAHAMRAAAREELGGSGLFEAVDGTAEETTLPAASVDLVAAGQAAHWFEPAAAAAEFRRILRPDGWTMLVWNTRDRHDAATSRLSELLARHPGANPPPRRRNTSRRDLRRLLGRGYFTYQFMHDHWLNEKTLVALALSKSYAPLPGDPQHDPLLAGLEQLFGRFQRDGRIRIVYQTEMFVGRPPAPARRG